MLRISTGTLFQKGTNGMLREQAKLGDTQVHIASGKRILTPSEDPAGAAQILRFNRAIDTINQHKENAGRIQDRLEIEEVALRSVSNALQRVRELAVQGGSDLYSAEQRRTMAVEVRFTCRPCFGHGQYSGYQQRISFFLVSKGECRPFTEAGGRIHL